MKVFADKHHGALTYSLQLLFEKRFEAEFYQPIGMEWWREKYWHVWNAEDTAGQYLGLHQGIKSPLDEAGRLLTGFDYFHKDYPIEDGIYYIKDYVYKTLQRGITLEKFKQTKFDIIIATMPQHIGPFIELQQKYQPQAKLIFQAGNAWHPDTRIKNFMGSIARCPVPPGVNAVFYHQEMSMDDFRYEPPTPESKKRVRSFVHYMSGKPRMNQIAACLPDWEFTSYGAGMEINNVSKMEDMGARMREAGFIFHEKFGADGFGHSIHSAFAVGRPLICSMSQYNNKLARDLMIHNQTCIDMDQMGSASKVAERLKEIVSTDEHERMCEAAAKRFREVVNYDQEFEQIKKFIDRLI